MTTPSLQEMIDNTIALMSSNVGAVLLLRKYGTTDDENQLATALQGANGGLAVEGVAGGTAIPVSGTVTATIADVATQTTLAAVLAKIIAAPATAALQTALNGYAADLPGTTTHVDVTATTFDPPLRMIMNNSATAGTISFKGPGDSSEVDMYLAAGEKVGLVQIAEVTDVDSLTLVGGY